MSKAYQCDNCREYFSGEPGIKDGIYDICPNCTRTLRILGKIDPFAMKNRTDKESKK